MRLSMGARKKTNSVTTKKTRLTKMAQTHKDKLFKLVSPTPKPVEKKARNNEVQNQFNESIQELTRQLQNLRKRKREITKYSINSMKVYKS